MPHAMFRKRKNSAKSKPTLQDLSPRLLPVTGKHSFAILLDNLLTPEECASLLRRAEDEGFDHALIQGPGGREILRQDIRACGRCIIDDAALADAVFQRIMNAVQGTEWERKVKHVPWLTKHFNSEYSSSSGGGAGADRSSDVSSSNHSSDNSNEYNAVTAVGLNERLRFLKYEPGQFFAPHQDIRYIRGPDSGPRAGETSHITVQIYLNEKCKGGSTRFLCGRRYYDVTPKTGSVLIFDHDLLHEGSKVTSGIKYSVRSDIMYTPMRRGSGGEEGLGEVSRTVTPESSKLDDA